MKFIRNPFNKVPKKSGVKTQLHSGNGETNKDCDAPTPSLELEMRRLRQGPGPDEFYSAILNLEKLGETAIPELKKVAIDPSQPSGFRARALETAAKIGGNDIGSILIQCANDPEFQVRWSAVSMIGKLRIREALPLLEELKTSDRSEWEVQPGFILSMNQAVTKAIEEIELA